MSCDVLIQRPLGGDLKVSSYTMQQDLAKLVGQQQQISGREGAFFYPLPVLESVKQPKENKKMIQNVKSYVEKHKDMLFTLGLIILIDHFVFKGALRTRIQQSMEGVLKTVENKFHKED